LSTKLRALYQRKQGRDLFDLAVAFERIQELNAEKIVKGFLRYMEHDGTPITRAQLAANLFDKLRDPVFTEDISPLLVFGEHPAPMLLPENAGHTVMVKLIALLPGEPWKAARALAASPCKA
jgi:Nucleotidyl transferase AbiEii toxin, Type IV TA system